MSGWVRYFALTAKAKTGLGPDVFAWGIVALLCAAAAVIFLVFAAFIVLAESYSPLTAALILAGVFLLGAILAGILCLMAQRRAATSAKLALAARANALWLDPRFLTVGLDIVRTIGVKKLVPLAAIGILAGGIAREWMASDKPREDGAGEVRDR